eukprot:COSAG02_NODE_14_length_56855_cov_512.793661_10_plen_87_part_00
MERSILRMISSPKGKRGKILRSIDGAGTARACSDEIEFRAKTAGRRAESCPHPPCTILVHISTGWKIRVDEGRTGQQLAQQQGWRK